MGLRGAWRTGIGTGQARPRSRARWKADVSAAALASWPAGGQPLQGKLQIHVTCYHDSAPPLDVDNMLKPIQDALIGIVYVDDGQLVDCHGHLRDVNAQYGVRGMTPAQAHGFVSNGPFVHIRIESPPVPGRLP
ncbi:RusA family crossover junction endodeoxyribonuclease [Micromonospora sp. NPDC005194]|uniref:RusA family crossover junction endodeoxyribonuclease n=1 Tax=Micromonospora sp. NPDC005194 TaxID=3156870 RepID=UPI00339F5E69